MHRDAGDVASARERVPVASLIRYLALVDLYFYRAVAIQVVQCYIYFNVFNPHWI